MQSTSIKQSEDSFEPQANSQREESVMAEGKEIQWQSRKYGGKSQLKKWLIMTIIFIVILVFGVFLFDAFGKHLRDYSLLKQEITEIKAEIQKEKLQVKQDKKSSSLIVQNKEKPQTLLQKQTKEEKKPQTLPQKQTKEEKKPQTLPQKQTKEEKKSQTLPQKQTIKEKPVVPAIIEPPKNQPSTQVSFDQKDAFVIPKKLWIYTPSDSSYFGQLTFDNNKHFGNESGFEVTVVDRSNFRLHLSKQKADEVEKFVALVESQGQRRGSVVIRTYILLNIINENGGVMTDGECTITENFDWIRKIAKNPYVNRGIREEVKPQVVGFYAMDYTNEKVKENIKTFPGMSEVDKYMAIFPSLEEYFIAANKKTPFITELIQRITSLIKNPSQFSNKQSQYQMGKVNGNDIHFNFLRIATQTILQDKQKQLDSANKQSFRQFAIDYYGLNLINCYYGPFKMQYFWGDVSREQFIMMSRFTYEEYAANFGPSSFITRSYSSAKMNSFFQDLKNGRLQPVVEGSLVQKLYFPTSAAPFIQKTKEKFFINETNEQWGNLPKKLWVFYDKGLSNAPIISQLCVQSMRRMGKLGGFEVIQVNKANAHQYLDAQTIKKIDYTMANTKLQTFPTSLSDLYRLALISKHGGLYLDSTYVMMESLEWLVNIGRYPSQHIFNRFGHLPKVVMLWYGQGSSPFDWKIDEKHNTKSLLKLGYQSNFIAAQKGNQLITEWFEMLTRLYIKPYSEIDHIFNSECPINDHKWTSYGWQYLIVMDSIKCVIARRQLTLQKEGNKEFATAADYYKLWSLDGNLGQQKLRTHTNYENLRSHDVRFAYRYSQDYVEGILGKFRQLTKFYGWHSKQMTGFVNSHRDGNFSSEAHPQSIFMRHIWQENFSMDKDRLVIKT